MSPPVGYAHTFVHDRAPSKRRAPPSPPTRAAYATTRGTPPSNEPSRRPDHPHTFVAPAVSVARLAGSNIKDTPISSKIQLPGMKFTVKVGNNGRRETDAPSNNGNRQSAIGNNAGERASALSRSAARPPTRSIESHHNNQQQHTAQMNTRSAQRLRQLLLFDLPPPAYSGGKQGLTFAHFSAQLQHLFIWDRGCA